MTTRSEPEHGRSDPGLDVIMSERRQLINLAYRLLGSLAEAEDAVQETYARWYAMSLQQQAAIDVPGAWLTTVAGRICLNLLGSARARRETYVGEWIPEPLPEHAEWMSGRTGDASVDPADRVTLDESVNLAFMVVLESMTPAERVAFILHDVFCHSFSEVAETVGRSPAACRQLAVSARRRIRVAQPVTAPATQHTAVIRDFKRAWETKDIDALIGLLDPDATAIADGGGNAITFLEPIEGGEQIAHAWLEIARRRPATMALVERTVNGQPGLVAQQGGVVVTVFAFEVTDDRIKHIWVVRNPEKLPSLDARLRPVFLPSCLDRSMPGPDVMRYAVLLRGVNVGGRRVAMPELRALAEELGYDQVSTYINSGNLLLSTAQATSALTRELERAISERFGFPVPVMVRTINELRAVVRENPYPEGNPSQVTVAFLGGKVSAGATERMTALATAEERFTLAGNEVYIDFAGGLGRSKLAAQLSKAIGTEITVRNIRTVQKLVDLLDA